VGHVSLNPVVLTIPAKDPFNFALYSEIFDLQDYRLPYHYATQFWRTLFQTESDELVPIEVVPDSPQNCHRLEVRIFYDIDSDAKKHVKQTIRSVFCTTKSVERMRGVPRQLRPFMKKYHGLKPHLSQDPFESLVKIIVRQLIGSEHAKKIITNLTRNLGNCVDVGGSVFHGFPQAHRLASASKAELLSCGVGYKWRYIKLIADHVICGDLDFEVLRNMNDEEVMEVLERFAGIGRWSTEVFLFDGLHRLETYPIFDITVQRAFRLMQVVDECSRKKTIYNWNSFGPSELTGFYATYMFAYFREVRQLGKQ
jgi:3-methyladenine DNA glycosylase/8-oxoguanine DNA glycosylase